MLNDVIKWWNITCHAHFIHLRTVPRKIMFLYILVWDSNLPFLRDKFPTFSWNLKWAASLDRMRNAKLFELSLSCLSWWPSRQSTYLICWTTNKTKQQLKKNYLISLWCSSQQMPPSRHSAPRAACWNILPDQKTSQQFSNFCATWYWTLRVHFLKSLSILFSSSWPHFSTGWWPALPMRRERTALLLRNMLTTRWTSSKSKLTWSPGRPPRRPTWPPQSPRRSGGGARWRERLLLSGGIRWEKCIW